MSKGYKLAILGLSEGPDDAQELSEYMDHIQDHYAVGREEVIDALLTFWHDLATTKPTMPEFNEGLPLEASEFLSRWLTLRFYQQEQNYAIPHRTIMREVVRGNKPNVQREAIIEEFSQELNLDEFIPVFEEVLAYLYTRLHHTLRNLYRSQTIKVPLQMERWMHDDIVVRHTPVHSYRVDGSMTGGEYYE